MTDMSGFFIAMEDSIRIMNNTHKTQTIKRRNFSCDLPNDFISIVSIQKKSVGSFLLHQSNPFQQNIEYRIFKNAYWHDTYVIKDKKIIFAGVFSRWLVIRFFQKIYDFLFPEKYILTYFDFKEVKGDDFVKIGNTFIQKP